MLSDILKGQGVVGAGGAGFPTYVKANSSVEIVLANGAECEPLIHKDVELMKNFPAEVVGGMRLMMEATKAQTGIFGIKEKNKRAIEAIAPFANSQNIEFSYLGDYYPSGDEYELVYHATGRLIPPAGLPLQVGCVVNNVETFYNVFLAAQNIPVTEKFVTIAGAVNEPKTFKIPVGTSFRDLIALAGGTTTGDFGMFVSGLMMGTLSFDLDDVVTKMTAGLIILPREHNLITRKDQPQHTMDRIGKSACDQCRFCTELCPRYLLGYEVEPHKVMRSLGFSLMGADNWNQAAELCCACGLCTLYACPEDLYPKEACGKAKTDMRSAGIRFTQTKEVRVHPMKEARRVPLSQLRKRLNVEEYETETPYEEIDFVPETIRIKLQQHVGKPAAAAVSTGQVVRRGDIIARIAESDMGVNIHASISGTVVKITDTFVEIHRQ